jgi:predicted CopG family antitoxin
MPAQDLKVQEEALQALLKKIDADVDKFSRVVEKLQGKHQELSDVVMDAGLSPVPIHFSVGKSEDVLKEVEAHILELNKLKNLIEMRLKRIFQEEELLDHLQNQYGKNVSFTRNEKGLIELQVDDSDAKTAYVQLQDSKKKLDVLREQIHDLAGDE